MKYIKRKSSVKLDETTGNIVDTLNVEDKVRNAPSINLLQQMSGVPTEGIIAYETEDGTIPEGYEEVDSSLIPSGVEEGMIVYIDDDAEIPEGYEEVDIKSIATFKTSDGHVDYTIETAYTPVMVKLEKKIVNIGNAFTLNTDGSITINKDCNVKVSCNLMVSKCLNPILTIRYVNNNTTPQLAEAYTFLTNATQWNTLVISPTIINFKKGDTIYVGVIAQSAGTVQVASWHFSWVTLEEV